VSAIKKREDGNTRLFFSLVVKVITPGNQKREAH